LEKKKNKYANRFIFSNKNGSIFYKLKQIFGRKTISSMMHEE
jgi:hypothetical protein